MTCRYGIFPDGANEPSAVFEELEDALEWGMEKFGADQFSIRHCSTSAEPSEDGVVRVNAMN